ncbi:ATP-binding protein [Phytoactinopolyspora halotolerans]|uniref:AAA family ATPase n=1 Tax=Phytoactinopolyspora halotolerans TaxID=1981512 RepID=A0A6L9S068_9ACTN|nr:AAA family ATPase [Phytoactinopolyspora halotolerans]NED98794.1 AAA family ATPase [Phytoactinopolyspora halotolerans]
MTPALIGRERPAQLLRAEVQRTLGSHGGFVLVAGEPGVGKTTLVAQVLHDADRQGALVVGGTCWDREGAPGYWPWVQAVRSLERQVDPAEWAAAVRSAGDGLTFLVGDISEPPPMGDLDDAAFRLCDSVTTLLSTIARRHPLIVALDDLHWADSSSLQMLDFVVRHTWFERVLVVGTYRDVEVETPDHPLRELLRPLEMKATTITLTGLDEPGVAALVTQVTGEQPDDELAAQIHRRTGGNPLFVEQMARLWLIGGTLETAPPSLRDAVDRHLSYLPKAVVEMLADAAVIGPEFHRQVLASVSGMPAAEAHQLLQQAALTRLVVPLESGRFRFAHDLVREILYDGLDPERRRRGHADVVRALQARDGGKTEPAHLAYHAYHAVPDVPVREAMRYLLAAGREAACRLASEEASTHYQRALELVADDEPRSRASVLLALADQYRRIGDADAARQRLDAVVELADHLGDEELRGRATATLGELTAATEPVESDAELDSSHPAQASDGAVDRRSEAIHPAPDRAAAGAAPGDAGSNEFRFDGAVWTLTFAGRTVHLPDAKGLRDLHVLLSNPGSEILASELLTAGGDAEALAGRRLGGDPVLDDTAKEQYRRRLAQLNGEIERAVDRGDDVRADELDRERDALLEELRTAAGLGGRTRHLGDQAERSRKTVTARIRDTLRRLDDRHPELAEHLRSSVSTGIACSYRPDTQIHWSR